MRPRWVSDRPQDYPDPTERLERRLLRAAQRHGRALSDREVEDAVCTMLDAGRDEYELPRGCIFMRHGRPCPGAVRGHCSTACDIPF